MREIWEFERPVDIRDLELLNCRTAELFRVEFYDDGWFFLLIGFQLSKATFVSNRHQ